MPLRDNMLSWWELNETSGTRVDAHGSNDLTDINTVTSGTGQQGNSALFTRANDEHLNKTGSFSPDLSIGTGDYSMVGWVKLANVADLQILASKYTSSNGNREHHLYFFDNSGADDLHWGIYDNLAGEVAVNTTDFAALVTGTWYFFYVYVDNGAANEIGISMNDGTVTTQTLGATATHDGGGGWWLGGQHATGEFPLDGELDEVVVWNRVLSSSEVTELYNSGSGLSYSDTGTHLFGGPTGGVAFSGGGAHF